MQILKTKKTNPTMLKGIISIAGKPGLYRLLSRGKNNLIVENLTTGKRMPTYAHEKVISLPDISIYVEDGDVPLPKVLQSLSDATGAQPVDVAAFANPEAMREYFATILPNFDRERVYNNDIRKLLTWYNLLLAAGITKFVAEEEPEEASKEA